jgi:WD40 repeat protein
MTHSPLEAPRWSQELDEFPTGLAWTKDLSSLAVATASGHLHLLGAQDGNPLRSFQAHEGSVQCLALHPSRPWAITGGEDGTAQRIRLDTGEHKPVGGAWGAWVEQAAWSPDGAFVALAAGRKAAIFNKDGALASRLPDAAHTITGLAWSPDSKILASVGYGGASLYFGKTGKLARRLEWKGSLLSVVWSPNGKVLACGSQDNSVHFWRLPSGQDAQMGGYPGKPQRLSFSTDGRWMATTGGAQVAVWNFEQGPEGKPPLLLEAHDQPLSAVAFAPNTKVLASGDRAGRVCLWAVGVQPHPVSHFQVEGEVEGLAWGVGRTARDLWLAVVDSACKVYGWPLAPVG